MTDSYNLFGTWSVTYDLDPYKNHEDDDVDHLLVFGNPGKNAHSNVQLSMFNVQYPMFNIQCSRQHSTLNTQFSTYKEGRISNAQGNAQHSTLNFQGTWKDSISNVNIQCELPKAQ